MTTNHPTRSLVGPLRFLVVRFLRNGIRRAFQTPTRAIATIAVLGYLLLFFGGNILSLFVGTPPMPAGTFHNIPVKEVVAFVTIALMLFFLSGTILPWMTDAGSSLFLQGDIQYFFPAPYTRLNVFRGLLIIRGFIRTFFVMMLMGFWLGVLFGGTLASSKTILPSVSRVALLIYPLALLPMVLSQIFLGAVCSIFQFRNKNGWRWFAITIASIFSICVLVCSITVRATLATGGDFWNGISIAFNHPVLYWLLLPVRGLAEAALLRNIGWTPAIPLAITFWVVFFIVIHEVMRKQSPWLYEYAAGVAQRSAEARERMRNVSLFRTESMKKKSEKGTLPVSQSGIFKQWKPAGVLALLWRDLIISWRLSKVLILGIVGFIAIMYPAAIIILNMFMPNNPMIIIGLYSFSQFFIVIYSLMNGYSSFVEHLKHIDIQKALPFSKRKTIQITGVSHIVLFSIPEFLLLVVAILFLPGHWGIYLYMFVLAVTFLYLGNFSAMLSAMIIPDQNDYVQQLISWMVNLPLFILCVAPGGIVIAVCFLLKLPLLINGALVLLTNLLVYIVMIVVCAMKYERFNPVD